MKKYEVINPHIVTSIPDGKGSRKELVAKQGDIIELPEDAPAVRAMLARRQIKEVAATPAKTAGTEK